MNTHFFFPQSLSYPYPLQCMSHPALFLSRLLHFSLLHFLRAFLLWDFPSGSSDKGLSHKTIRSPRNLSLEWKQRTGNLLKIIFNVYLKEDEELYERELAKEN